MGIFLHFIHLTDGVVVATAELHIMQTKAIILLLVNKLNSVKIR